MKFNKTYSYSVIPAQAGIRWFKEGLIKSVTPAQAGVQSIEEW